MKKIALPAFFGYWAFLLLSLLPIFYAVLQHSLKLERIQALNEKMEIVYARKQLSDAMQKKQRSLLSSLAESDRYYIDKNLESLVFLESEIKKMEALVSDATLDDTSQKRLHFLKQGSNSLLFAEDKTRTHNKIREVTERQQHAVEMNEEDLKKLLCLIEGVTIWPYGPKEGIPQLIIQDFQLAKKRLDAEDHVFTIHMNIIKRENSET